MSNNFKFLNQYNKLEATLSNIFFPNANKYGYLSILERLVDGDISQIIKTIRETRNMMVHNSQIKNKSVFNVSKESIKFLGDIEKYIDKNRARLRQLYTIKYASNTIHPNKASKLKVSNVPEGMMADQINKELINDKLFKKGANVKGNKLIDITISMVKKWSKKDKLSTLEQYNTKYNKLFSLDRQVAEVLLKNLDPKDLEALLSKL